MTDQGRMFSDRDALPEHYGEHEDERLQRARELAIRILAGDQEIMAGPMPGRELPMQEPYLGVTNIEIKAATKAILRYTAEVEALTRLDDASRLGYVSMDDIRAHDGYEGSDCPVSSLSTLRYCRALLGRLAAEARERAK